MLFRSVVPAFALVTILGCASEPTGDSNERANGEAWVRGSVVDATGSPVSAARLFMRAIGVTSIATGTDVHGVYSAKIVFPFHTAVGVPFYVEVTPPEGSALASVLVDGLVIDLHDPALADTDTLVIDIVLPPAPQAR